MKNEHDPDDEKPSVRNEHSGDVYGTMGQFGNVHGDINLNSFYVTPEEEEFIVERRKRQAEEQAFRVEWLRRMEQDETARDRHRQRMEEYARRSEIRESDSGGCAGCLGFILFLILLIFALKWLLGPSVELVFPNCKICGNR